VKESEEQDYVNDILCVIEKQRQKGISEYGKKLEEDKEYTLADCIQNAMEEAVDSLFYLAHAKRILEKEQIK